MPRLSEKAVMCEAMSWLKASLTEAAWPTSPTRWGSGPKHSMKGRQRSYCSAVEPTATSSVPATA